jgi:hypothetical protein
MADRLNVAATVAESLPAAISAVATARIPEIFASFSGCTFWKMQGDRLVECKSAGAA